MYLKMQAKLQTQDRIQIWNQKLVEDFKMKLKFKFISKFKLEWVSMAHFDSEFELQLKHQSSGGQDKASGSLFHSSQEKDLPWNKLIVPLALSPVIGQKQLVYNGLGLRDGLHW